MKTRTLRAFAIVLFEVVKSLTRKSSNSYILDFIKNHPFIAKRILARMMDTPDLDAIDTIFDYFRGRDDVESSSRHGILHANLQE